MSNPYRLTFAGFLVGGLALCLLGLSQTHFTVKDLGLIRNLHPLFFIGLSIITAELVLLARIEKAQSGLTTWAVGAVLFLAFILVGLPLFIGGSQPVLWQKYEVYRWVDYISRFGRLDPPSIDYHRYPLAFVLVSMALQIIGFPKAGGDPYLLLELFPPVMTVLWLALLALFFSTIADGRGRTWIPLALWIFVLGVWDNFAAIGAQSLGYLSFLVVLGLTSRIYFSSPRPQSDRPGYLLLVLAFASISLTHLLSALLGLAVVVGTLVYGYATRRESTLLAPALLLAAFVGAWLTTGASAWFNGLVPIFVEHALRLDEIFNVSVIGRLGMSGNETTEVVATVRLYYSIGLVLLGTAAALIELLSRRHAIQASVVMMLSVLFPVFIIGTTYGGEILDRGYYVALPFLSYFATYYTSRRLTTAILCAFLIVSGPTYVLARNGHLSADYLSSAYRASLRFFVEHGAPYGSLAGNVDTWGYWLFRDTYTKVPQRSQLITGYAPLPTFLRNPALYRGVLLEDLVRQDISRNASLQDLAFPLYVGMSRHTEAIYDRTLNRASSLNSIKAILATDAPYGRFYSNADTDLYVAEAMGR